VKVFVTGGSSPLGEVVVPKLSERMEVHGLARSPLAAERLIREGAAAVVRGELETPGAWLSTARAADAVVHLAGMRFVDVLIRQLDVEQPLTVVGSASVHNPAHADSAWLRAGEQRLMAMKRDGLVILRPTMIYGSSRDRNIRLLARLITKLPAVPRLTGGGLIQPVLVDDVADAIVTTVGARFLSVDVGGPVPIRLGALVAELARLLERRVAPVPVSVDLLARIARLVSDQRPSRAIHALAMLRHDRVVAPMAPEVLGHSPTPLSQGLRLALDRYGLVHAR
jgi:nucleoside-diphosphate-sugar epimerase